MIFENAEYNENQEKIRKQQAVQCCCQSLRVEMSENETTSKKDQSKSKKVKEAERNGSGRKGRVHSSSTWPG